MNCLFCDGELSNPSKYYYRCVSCERTPRISAVIFCIRTLYPLVEKNGKWNPTGESVQVITKIHVSFLSQNNNPVVFRTDRLNQVSTFETKVNNNGGGSSGILSIDREVFSKHNLDLKLEEIPAYYDKIMLLK